jgi:hypothetical protein
MIDFGPQIAIIDDKQSEVKDIYEFFNSNNIGCKYFNADITENNKPEKPIESVELVFLDLYYLPEFDPYLCADWINSVISEHKLYELIVWSKDSHKSEDLRKVLIEINKAPRYLITKQKSDYQTNERILILIEEIKTELVKSNNLIVNEFLAEIVDISEEQITLNCLLDLEKPYYQIRKFDKKPFLHFINLKIGTTLIVKTTSKMGERVFEYIEQFVDNTKYFEQKNIFLKLKESPLFNPKQK